MALDRFAVVDIGKTNAKLVVADAHEGAVIWSAERRNRILPAPPFKQLDHFAIGEWLLDAMADAPEKHRIGAIVPVTHACAAVALDAAGHPLPALDYEDDAVEAVAAAYLHERDDFASTFTPDLPLGLNLGRQIFFLEAKHPELFRRFATLLLYPQYWAWLLSGKRASEVTSLGCHSGLWRPKEKSYSHLAERRGWTRLFPPMRPAGEALGPLLPAVAARTGLPADCRVLCGIHDSNCSYLNHALARPENADFCVISTGTWVIALASGVDPTRLDPKRDMLGNVDAFGRLVATARFMGGREYGIIAGENAAAPDVAALAHVIEQGAIALPNFTAGGGPFMGQSGRIVDAEGLAHSELAAMASLYVALMTDVMIELLGTKGEIIVEGSFLANPLFAPILAALRPSQRVSMSDDRAGTIGGARLLATAATKSEARTARVTPVAVEGLTTYASNWRKRITP